MSSTPYYQDDRAAIYMADACEVLSRLPAASVDALITDPPYSSGGAFRGDRSTPTGSKYVSSGSARQLSDFPGDNRDQRSYAFWCQLWLAESVRVVKPGGVCALFTDWRQLPTTTDALQSGGYVWRGIVPWAKPVARPMLGRFAAQCEYLVWGTNGPRTIEGDALPGFYEAMPPRNRDHQTQKPIDVMRKLVRIAPRGGTVLDLFTGSGTTGVAAILEGRNFVGSEIVPDYAAVTVRRIKEAQLAPDTGTTQDGFDFTSLHPEVTR